MPSAVAFRYARALAHLAPDADRTTADLAAFERAMSASGDLRTAMQSPAVTPPRKRAVIARLAKMLPLSDLARRFLFVLADHRRIGLLSQIREAFELVMDEQQGIVRADIVSARPLNDRQRDDVLSALSHQTGKRIRAQFETRPELIGGVLARLGSTVYDGSVKGQLQALKAKLAGAEG